MASAGAKPADQIVTIIGGSGFVGRHVVRALAKRGYRIRVAVRRPDLAGHLQPLGTVGQIHAVQANIRDADSIERAVAGSDVVINLVGILYESGKQTFDAVQGDGPRLAARAAKAAGAKRFIQMSAIGSDADGDADYARTKARGEQGALSEFPETIILRPSIVFGPEDDFFNRFGGMARLAPALPLIGGGHTRFQPVFVGDVAEAVARAVDGDLEPGTTYELGGPDIETFKELLQRMLEVIGRKRLLVTLPMPIARLQATVLGALPKPMLTLDQIRLLERDNVVSEAAIKEGRTLDGIGIEPQTMSTILPTYLSRFRKTGAYAKPNAA
ncbi:MAG: complex I NDUFA9 subunit family protein [Pseudomonadota bacterium]